MNVLTELFSTSLAQRIGWGLIHFLWQGAAVALGLAVILSLLGRRSARARWAASCGAMVLMAALPIATAMVVSVEATEQSQLPPSVAAEAPAQSPLPSDVVESPVEPESASIPLSEVALAQAPYEEATPSPPTPPASTTRGDLSTSVSWSRRFRDAICPVLPWAIVVWLAGVMVMLVWHVGGVVQIRGLRRRGTRAAGVAVQETFDRLLVRLRVRRSVRLLESVRVAVPIVIRWLRPVVLLPAGMMTGLTPRQLEAILAHELAHVRRWDCLVQVLQAAMETLLFYHPGVWWVSRQIRQESEQCCDDMAVGLCPDRAGYAHALAKVAELGAARKPAFAAAATGGKLMPRIRRLMRPDEAGSSSHAWPVIVALMAVVFASSMLLTIVQAQPATAPTGEDGKAARIAELIVQLGSEKYDDRERACRELVKIGQPAFKALREAANDKDIERAARAKTTLVEIRKRGYRFAIYLVAQPADLHQAEKTPLDKLQLEDEPLLSDDDVVGYDWDSHVLQLTKEAGARLAHLGYTARYDWHPPFVVTRGNQRRYLGTLWQNREAVLPRVPLIYFRLAEGARVGDNAIRIEPPPAPGAEDPRGDEQVRAGLTQLGRLRKAKGGGGNAEVPWGVAAGGLQCRLRLLTPTVAPHRAALLRDQEAYVVYELRNVSDKPIRLLPWSTPITRMFTTDFRVLGPDGKAAKYVGLCVSPVPPGHGSFLAIGPGQVLSQRAPLAYDFTSPGVYKVSTTKHADKQELKWFYGKDADALAKNPDRVWTGTLASNTVTMSVQAPAKPTGATPPARLRLQVYRLAMPAPDVDKLKKSLAGSTKNSPPWDPDLKRQGLVSDVGSVDLALTAGARLAVQKTFSTRRTTPMGPIMAAGRGQLEASIASAKLAANTPLGYDVTVEVSLTGLVSASRRGDPLPAGTVSPFKVKYVGRIAPGQPAQVFTKTGTDKCVYLVWLRLKAPARPATPPPATKPVGSRLSFRVAPAPSALTKTELASCRTWLKAGRIGFWWKEGRIAGLAGRMPSHAWLPLSADLAGAQGLVTGEFNGQKYVLVSDKPGQTVVRGEGKAAWGLTQVHVTRQGDRPAVGFEMDDGGAKLFAAFTKANVNTTIAVLVDGEVVSMPMLRAPLGKRGIITGRFTEQEVNALVKALKAGMPPARATASPVPWPVVAHSPTAGTLGAWLAGKEVIEVSFAGPHMELRKLRESLKIKMSADNFDFRLTPGEGGGVNRSFINVCMKVTPANVRSLLSLQDEMTALGYRLDPADTRIWSLEGDASARTNARKTVSPVLAATAKAIKTALPNVQCSPERPRKAMYLTGIKYEVPGTTTSGMIRINEITATKRWDLSAIPDQTIHLPRLGLMITAYYRPGRDTTKDASPARAVIRKAINAAVAPLLKLEGDTVRRHEQPVPQPVKAAEVVTPRDAKLAARRTADTRSGTNKITITADMTWSGEAAINGRVTVAEGVTLTIKPGTVVKITGGWDAKLIVSGRLDAVGTEDRPIRFEVGPKPSYWTGISFNGPKAGGVMEWCHLGNGGRATVTCHASSPTIRHCAFSGGGRHPLPGWLAGADRE